MNVRVVSLAIVVCAVSASQAVSSNPGKESRNFFLAAIQTEVHRRIVTEGASAYGIVNCNALASEAELQSGAWGEAEFRDELKRIESADPSCLTLQLRYQLPDGVSDITKDLVKVKLKDLGRECGFQKVNTTEDFTTWKWKHFAAGIPDLVETEGACEPIVEDDLIRAYPLRTRLSWLVLGYADCIVEIKRRFNGGRRELSRPLQASIRHAIESLALGSPKGILLYKASGNGEGARVFRELFNSDRPVSIPSDVTDPAILAEYADKSAKYKPSSGMLSMELGFDEFRSSFTTGGEDSGSNGAPERLVGKPAPNFTLETLQGEDLELRSFIQDRPALVTFWGVACGPCRREAPHLTRMHEKYGSDLAIVAVNGYDESREKVSAFAEEKELQHVIVLDGRTVAKDLYRVGAYPTTFWINRDGIVEDYEVDFDTSAALERRVTAMLEID